MEEEEVEKNSEYELPECKMWAAIHTGAGTALTDAWNGAPALYLGAINC